MTRVPCARQSSSAPRWCPVPLIRDPDPQTVGYMTPAKNSIVVGDSIRGIKTLPDDFVHMILSDIPYGIGADDWDVLHDNSNSAFLGSSPAQKKARSEEHTSELQSH